MSSEIGRRIAAAREATGLSIETVAEYLDMDATDVSGIEAGTRQVDLDTLIRLSDLFGRSPEYFLSGRDDPDHRITLLHPRSLSPRDRVRLAPIFRLLREYIFIRSLTSNGGGERPDSKKPRL